MRTIPVPLWLIWLLLVTYLTAFAWQVAHSDWSYGVIWFLNVCFWGGVLWDHYTERIQSLNRERKEIQ